MKSLVAKAPRGARKGVKLREEGECEWEGAHRRGVVLGAGIGLLLDLGDTYLGVPFMMLYIFFL